VLALLTFIADLKKDNVIFAMEEPEIALPPYTQRRITNYLIKETSQCFITSHSPYVIERFEPDGIVKLNRDNHGSLTGTAVKLPTGMKVKTYRHNFRRALAEAMLSRAVIVGEGITEQDALLAAAEMIESNCPNLYPLDVAGVCVMNAEGDGNLEKMGAFFKQIEIPAFAFFDRKERTDEEVTALRSVFEIATEIEYKGAETLMAEETPLDRQWQYLEALRDEDGEDKFKIPAARPTDDALRKLTVATLRSLKGEGGAARLLDTCTLNELPVTITTFLDEVYKRYSLPKTLPTDPEGETTDALDEFAAGA
jgi:putative ATP-dependent endonuclease of OLD family